MTRHSNRREFLKNTALVGAGVFVAGHSVAQESKSANEKINFASIGVGGKGDSDTADANQHGNLVAICDIDESRLDGAAKRYPKAKKFTDYRKMLEEMKDSIDAVTVSTPDHHHAVASIMAMKLGKHCFCQKPLTHTVWEARQMASIAKEKKLYTQMGNQGTSRNELRKSAALIKAGVIGTIKEVHVWTNRPIWAQGGPRPATKPVPKNLNWDLFLGPAPERPYGDGYHPFAWRGWWDFGTGALGDMACHTFNMPYMALNLADPTAIEAESPGHNKDSYPKWSQIKFEFPKTDARPAINVFWYDGGKKPELDLFGGARRSDSGSLIIGEKGSMYSAGDYGDEYKFIGKDKIEEPAVEFVRGKNHFTEWADAIKTGKQSMSNFAEYSGKLTETILLGNLAVWAGKRIEWDAKNLKATNAPEVAHIVKKEYRKGWEI